MSKNQNLTDNADNKPQNTKKKILTAIGIAAAILLLGGLGAGLFLLNRGGGERDSSSVNISGMPRENVLDLAKRYISRGEYDRAMDLLDSLLLQNPSDADALAMLDEIIALKQGVPLSNFPRYSDVPSYSLDDLQRLYAQQNQSADELDKLIAELSAKQDSLTPEEQQRLAELQKRREEIAQANKEMSQLFELLQQLQEQSAADRAKLDELLQKQSSSGLSSAETARINELLKEQQEQMQMIDFPFSDLVEEMVQSFQTLAKAQNKTFTSSIQPMLSLCGDERSLRQLLSVLLDNALKYSDEGGRISLTLEKQGQSLRLSVFNTTSQPVDRQHTERLFNRFYRGDQSRNSKIGGYGIGLSIAAAVTANHKGRISAATQDGKSLTITVMLPVQREKRMKRKQVDS